MVPPRGLLQGGVSAGAQHGQRQAADGPVPELRAGRRLCVPVQVQHRLLCDGQPQRADAEVRPRLSEKQKWPSWWRPPYWC